MSIPMGGRGNVDGEGGTAHLTLHSRALAYAGGVADVSRDHLVREWLESCGLQSVGSIRRPGATRLSIVDESGAVVFTGFVEAIAELDELPNDADDHGTHDER